MHSSKQLEQIISKSEHAAALTYTTNYCMKCTCEALHVYRSPCLSIYMLTVNNQTYNSVLNCCG